MQSDSTIQVSRDEVPYVICVDVGSPKNLGWADSNDNRGNSDNLGHALDTVADFLKAGASVALGFEAPIWTPMRPDLMKITSSRGGIEKEYNRAWSAGAGTGALGAALAVMPWCFAQILRRVEYKATVRLDRFLADGGLFIWEAFVTGKMKKVFGDHHDDAFAACEAFASRWSHMVSDIPQEPALNHAVSSALSVGVTINPDELTEPAIVIGAALLQ